MWRSARLHDHYCGGAWLGSREDVPRIARVGEVVARADRDRVGYRARERPAGAEHDMLDRSRRGRVRHARFSGLHLDQVDVPPGARRAGRQQRGGVAGELRVDDRAFSGPDHLDAGPGRIDPPAGRDAERGAQRPQGLHARVPHPRLELGEGRLGKAGAPSQLGQGEACRAAFPADRGRDVADQPGRRRSGRRGAARCRAGRRSERCRAGRRSERCRAGRRSERCRAGRRSERCRAAGCSPGRTSRCSPRCRAAGRSARCCAAAVAAPAGLTGHICSPSGLLVRFDEQLLRVFRIVDMSSFWRTLDRSTLRDIALVCLADAVVGASFGAITVSGGLPAWLPVAMSLLIFAGGAQFAAVGVLLAGGSPVAAILAGLVLNTRLFPYGLAIPDVLGGSWLARLAGAHVLTDESVAFALRQPDRARRRAAFWTCGIGLFAIWNLAVMAGVAAGRAIGNTGVIGLDAVFPAVLVALVLPSLADRATRDAALLGALIAMAASMFLPAGIPVLLALSGLVLVVPRGRRRSGEPRRAWMLTRPRVRDEPGATAGQDGQAAEGR